MPSTGVLRTFQPPRLFGVRVETGYQQGQEVSPFYDALLAKIIAKGSTREQAIDIVALQAFTIQGVQTNAGLLLRVLRDLAFLRGDIDTGMVARILRAGRPNSRPLKKPLRCYISRPGKVGEEDGETRR